MGKIIMTADDSASVRQMVNFTLTQAGYEVIEAVDGEDALEKLKSKPVNMLFADLNMPKMDGIELIKQIKSLRPKMSILMRKTQVVSKVRFLSSVQDLQRGVSDISTEHFWGRTGCELAAANLSMRKKL